jgi:arsenite methyltransferase
MEVGSPFQVLEEPCSTPAASEPSLHEELTTLLLQYDVNTAAASVKPG